MLEPAEGKLCSIRQVIVSLRMVRYYFMQEPVAAAVENSDVVVRLERVGCDNHDLSVEVVQVVD